MIQRLEMQNVSKRYPGVMALKGINMMVGPGEIVALLGENGAGKSTLVKILSGAIPYGQYGGHLLLNDEVLKLANTRQANQHGIAMIPQELNIQPDLSIAENIVLGNWPMRGKVFIDTTRMIAVAKEALKKLDFDVDVNIKAGDLNSSLQQMVCIARALVQNPSILILDEPTSALTKTEAGRLLERVRALRNEGICCLYITHKIDEVFQIADRVVVFRDGSLISSYSREEMDLNRIIEDIVGKKGIDYHKQSYVQDEVVLSLRGFSIKHPYAQHKMLLENVSFDLRKGEILGLAGLLGSGRSELLKAAFGALPKVSGEIFLHGKKVEIRTTSDAIGLGIGLLTENRGLDGYVKTMNVGQNMSLAILRKLVHCGLINRHKEMSLIREYFDRVQIKAPSHRTPILSLSGGNQQKVLVSKWLMNESQILFLDEPTRGIDIGSKEEIYHLMSELARQGTSIIMVSSELPEMVKVCDRYIILAGGAKVGEVDRRDQPITEALLMEKISNVKAGVV